MVYGAATRNAAAALPTTASDAMSREGLVPSVIQTAMSGTTIDSPPGYFVAAASPAAAPAQAKLAARSRSWAFSVRSSVSVTKNVTGTSVST